MRALVLFLAACSSPAPSSPEGSYAGRPIAHTCSYLGAEWLERPDRETREEPEKVLDAIGLAPAMTVADVGAGTGYFTRRLAKRVAKVYATELQPEMLELLAKQTAPLANVTTILATATDQKLPPACCDVVLLVDVYHELSDPPATMRGIARALAPGGRLVLVEYRGEDPAVPIKPEHKMTLAKLRTELASLGFAFQQSHEMLRDQRVVVFTVQ